MMRRTGLAAAGPAEFQLAGGQTYQARLKPLDGSATVKRQVTISEADTQLVVIAIR